MARSRYGNSIAQLMLQRGDIAAQGQMRSANLWGGLANTAANALVQHSQYSEAQRQEEEKLAEQEQRQEHFNQALATWDGQDMREGYRMFAPILGVDGSVKFMEGWGGLQKMQNDLQAGGEVSPGDAGKTVAALADIERKMPGWMESNWPSVYPLVKDPAAALGVPTTEEFNPGFVQGILAIDEGRVEEGIKPGAGQFTLGDTRYTPEGEVVAQGTPELPNVGTFERQLLDKYGPKPTPQQVEQERAHWAGLIRAPEAPPEADRLAEMEPSLRFAADRAIMMVPAHKKKSFREMLGRQLEAGNEKGIKEVIVQAAIEGENVDAKNQIRGRRGTVLALEHAENLISTMEGEGVPTGWFRGTAENLARRLGKSTNPRYVELKTQLTDALVQYRRAATGVAFGERESAQYEGMFPNYSQEMPVNLAAIRGLRRAMQINDRAYWTMKLGDEGADLLSVGGVDPLTSQSPGGADGNIVRFDAQGNIIAE